MQRDPSVEALSHWIELISHELWLLQMTQQMLVYHNSFTKRFGHMPMFCLSYEYTARHDSGLPLGIIYGGTPPANAQTKCVRVPYEVPSEILGSEIRALLAERQALLDAVQDASAYAPGGSGHRRLVRHYAGAHGMHRYALRPQVEAGLSADDRRVRRL